MHLDIIRLPLLDMGDTHYGYNVATEQCRVWLMVVGKAHAEAVVKKASKQHEKMGSGAVREGVGSWHKGVNTWVQQ